MMKPHQAAGANTPFAITHRHDTCICKQMSYVFRCLEMVGFPHYHFVEACRTQADSKLQVANLVFPSTSTNLLFHGVALCTCSNTPTFSISSISCLKTSFKCTMTGLFGSNGMWYGKA